MARHPDTAPNFDTIIRRLGPMKRGRMINIFLADDGNIGISMQRHTPSNAFASGAAKPGEDVMEKLLQVIGPGATPGGWAAWLGLDNPDAAAAAHVEQTPDEPADDDDEDDWENLI